MSVVGRAKGAEMLKPRTQATRFIWDSLGSIFSDRQSLSPDAQALADRFKTDVSSLTDSEVDQLFDALSLGGDAWKDQPRDEHGQWAETGASGGGESREARAARMAKEADAAVPVLDQLLPKVLERADFSQISGINSGPESWYDLDESTRDQVLDAYVKAGLASGLHDNEGKEDAEEWLEQQIGDPDSELSDRVRDMALKDFVSKMRSEYDVAIDPDTLEFYNRDLNRSSMELRLSALRTVDGEPLDSAQWADASELFDDVVESSTETVSNDVRENSDEYREVEQKGIRRSISAEFDGMYAAERLEWAKTHDIDGDTVDEDGDSIVRRVQPMQESDDKLPTEWKWERNGIDYEKTRVIARQMAAQRAADVIRERGLGATQIASIVDNTRIDATDDLVSNIIGDVWSGWKEDSHSAAGLALQLAVSREFNTVHRLTDDQVTSALNRAGQVGTIFGENPYSDEGRERGIARLQAYVRAQWETTQYVMRKADVEHVDVYRAMWLNLPNADELEAGDRLPDLSLKRGALYSTTTKADIANGWDGVGEKPEASDRVVLRMRIPREGVFTVPAFGQNVFSEQEVVGMGLAGDIKWDAWFRRAPEQWSRTPIAASERRSTTVIDLAKIDREQKRHWLNGWRRMRNGVPMLPKESINLSDAWKDQPRDENGRWAETGDAPGASTTMVGITSARPESDPAGTHTNRATYQKMREFEDDLRKLPLVKNIKVQPGIGQWAGGSEPSWVVTYDGNGEARALLAKWGKSTNQDAVLVMRAGGQSPVVELEFEKPMSASARDGIAQLLDNHGIGGWTWYKRNGKTVLRAVAVPEWGGDPYKHRVAMDAVSRGLHLFGVDHKVTDRNVEVEVMERSGQHSYDNVLNDVDMVGRQILPQKGPSDDDLRRAGERIDDLMRRYGVDWLRYAADLNLSAADEVKQSLSLLKRLFENGDPGDRSWIDDLPDAPPLPSRSQETVAVFFQKRPPVRRDLRRDWDPEDHPRDEDGQFTDTGGSVTIGQTVMRPATADDAARLRALRVPPAWTRVHLSEDPDAALQATGFDAKGRQQYRYSAEHSESKAAEKFERVKSFTKALPRLRSKVERDMRSRDAEIREAASVVYLIDKTGFRIGSDKDTKGDVEAFGASTLKAEHVTIDGDSVTFSFTAKKGVRTEKNVTDPTLAKMLEPRLKNPDGALFDTDDGRVRRYLKDRTGRGFTPKDFRTYQGTAMAYELVRDMAPPTTQKELKKAMKTVATSVAAHLGNTPTVSLKSYIAPAVWSRWKVKKRGRG